MKKSHKERNSKLRATWEPWVVFVGLFLLVLFFWLAFASSDAEAQHLSGNSDYENRMLEAQESQAKSLKRIADELRKIRQKMEK